MFYLTFFRKKRKTFRLNQETKGQSSRGTTLIQEYSCTLDSITGIPAEAY